MLMAALTFSMKHMLPLSRILANYLRAGIGKMAASSDYQYWFRRQLLLRKKVLLLKKWLIIRKKRLVQRREKPRPHLVQQMCQQRTTLLGHCHNPIQMLEKGHPAYYKRYMRMSPQTFEHLEYLIRDRLTQDTLSREMLSPSHKLAITLRYLATGASFFTIAMEFSIRISTVRNVVREICTVIWDMLQPTYLQDLTVVDWSRIAEEFDEKWDFPHCCGAVDAKQIVTEQNAKKTDSVVLMAAVDAQFKFISMDVRNFGLFSRAVIFKESSLGRSLEDGVVTLPRAANLPRSSRVAPYVLVGGTTIQLRPDFMRPYSSEKLTSHKRIFNYRLSRARRCSENAFGILSQRWRIFKSEITLGLDHINLVTQACVVLHNFLMVEETYHEERSNYYCPSGYADYIDETGQRHKGTWRKQEAMRATSGLQGLLPTNANNYSHHARAVREWFSEYFMSPSGEVPWQWHLPDAN